MKLCRECYLEEADDDGFCSESCAQRWDREMFEDDDVDNGDEGGEA